MDAAQRPGGSARGGSMSLALSTLAFCVGAFTGCGGGSGSGYPADDAQADSTSGMASPLVEPAGGFIAQRLAADIHTAALSPAAAQAAINAALAVLQARPQTRAAAPSPSPSRPKRAEPGSGAATFSFELPRAATTSAGVFDTRGRLVRTLWSGEPLPAGAQTYEWDGRDDRQQPLAADGLEVRVLHHRISHQWEGVIGNSSAGFGGAALHKAFLPVTSLAAVGDKVVYAVGYNEAQSGLHGFRTAEPGTNTRPARLVDPFAAVTLVAADASRVYWANTGGLSNSSFVSAVEAADGKRVAFAQGRDVCLNPRPGGSGCWADQDHRGVIGAQTEAGWAPTGLAVQRSGRLLAVAHGAKNLVRLYDKTTGALLRQIEVPMSASAGMPAPGSAAKPLAVNQIAFTPRGDLWVIGGRQVHRYTGLELGKPQLAATIGTLAQPLAVAVHPRDEDSVWVADGGGRQQLRRFDRRGAPLAAAGDAGGYATDPGASLRKMCFTGVEGQPQAALTVTADGTLWAADTCNNRLLRVRTDGRIDAPLAYLPAVYAATVDMADARRVFANFLEFEVDTAAPLKAGQASWVLRRNWLPSLPAALADTAHRNHGFGGLRSVLTLATGRTVALLEAKGRQHIVELPESGPLQLLLSLPATATGATPAVLYEDGSIGWAETHAGVQQVLRRRLAGSDADGRPLWSNAAETIASVPVGTDTPHARGAFTGILGPRFPVTASGRVVFFDSSVQGNDGFHLGAADLGGNEWAWLASPSGVLDGRGSFQTRRFDGRIEYGGNAVWAHGAHVVYGFHGEFYTDATTGRVGQANQFMHFHENGLFIGQFGVPSTRDAAEGTPGLSGNAFSPTLVRAGTAMYLLHNDESAHGGVHRWRIDGWDSVHELRAAIVFDQARR